MDGEEKNFCCEGCARVFSVAYENGLLEQVMLGSKSTARRVETPSASPLLIFNQKRESAFFDIDGMWCAGCALAAERVLKNQPGIKDVSVNFATERGRIEYDPARVDLPEMMKI